MPKDNNNLESAQENHFTSTIFSHEWISYNPKKLEITFSDEAKSELQKLVESIQERFPAENKNTESSDDALSVKNITESTIANVTDAMIVAGKWKKSVGKFLERVKILLQGKKKWWKLKEIEEKVEKKVEKYRDTHFAHIVLEYTEWWESKTLPETPIIIRPGEKLAVMLWSLQTRIRFSRIKK
jgi:hypothetical protein